MIINNKLLQLFFCLCFFNNISIIFYWGKGFILRLFFCQKFLKLEEYFNLIVNYLILNPIFLKY